MLIEGKVTDSFGIVDGFWRVFNVMQGNMCRYAPKCVDDEVVARSVECFIGALFVLRLYKLSLSCTRKESCPAL